MVKLLAIDVDGTLVNTEKQISVQNFEAIQYAVSKGVTVVLNSGRPHLSIRQYAIQLGLEGPIISSNGALVRESSTGTKLLQLPIVYDDYSEAYRAAKDMGCKLSIYSGDRVLTESGDALFNFYFNDCCRLPTELRFPVEIVPDLLLDKQAVTEPIYKIEISGLNEKNSSLFHERLSKIVGLNATDCDYSNVFHCEYKGMEITHKGAGKGKGLAYLAESIGINRSEVMAIGDSPNDVSMLRFAGVPYVMGNAKDSLKALFPNVTASNTESGVAKAILREI